MSRWDHRNELRAQRTARLRAEVFAILGDRCHYCGAVGPLQVHHVNGTTWNQRKVNAETRWYRYRRELREGVPLRAACGDCNKAIGRPEESDSREDFVAPEQEVTGCPF